MSDQYREFCLFKIPLLVNLDSSVHTIFLKLTALSFTFIILVVENVVVVEKVVVEEKVVVGFKVMFD